MSIYSNSSSDKTADQNSQKTTETADREAVWSFRGYRLGNSEFNTAMVHLFRAEVTRANVWRQRLDATTNWAVLTTGAAISFAFSQSLGYHFAIILNALLVTMFLLIEARRYRYYELWSTRIRLMETDFFGAMLVPPFHPAPDWAETLSENLLHPHFTISNLEAIGRRLRRNYIWIYAILFAAWLGNLWLLPTPTQSWLVFTQRAGIGSLNGEFVFLLAATFFSLILLITFGTAWMHEASGEILPRYLFPDTDRPIDLSAKQRKRRPSAWFRPSRRRQQFISLIITDQAQTVADKIMTDMKRGVTSLAGTGMYTNQEHPVLFCALTITEVPQLKSLVAKMDPHAFVIISPAQEVLGQGFLPIRKDE